MADSPPGAHPHRLSPEVEEAHAALVKSLHGTLLQAHINAPSLQRSAVDTLLTLVQNVLREPGNEKFRRLRATNELFKSRVLAAKGADEFLSALGFRSQTLDFVRFLVLDDAHFNDEILRVGERLLVKCQRAVAEKAERHEKELWLKKNEGKLERERALIAIAEDKARRAEKAVREAETKRLVQPAPAPPTSAVWSDATAAPPPPARGPPPQ